MYHKAFSVKTPESSIVLSQRNNFVKSVRRQYGNLDLHASFFHENIASSARK